MSAFRYAERKGSTVVGGDRLLVGIHHQYAVTSELHTRYRNARTFVIDIATIYIIGVDGKDEITLQVHVLVEADHLWLEASGIAHRCHADAVAACLLIDQAANLKIAGGVRDGSHHLCSRNVSDRFGCHGEVS